MKLRVVTFLKYSAAAWLFVALLTAPAHAIVVFGNLGNDGTSNLGSSLTDFGNDPPDTDATQRLATGFQTGALSTDLVVQSITLGLFGATPPASPIPMAVAIYANNGGVPSNSPLYLSSAVNIAGNGKYSFSFTNALLNTSTQYWVIPETATTGTWINNALSTAPAGRNGSGYTFAGALRYGVLDPEEGGDRTLGWYAAPTTGMAVSIQAVPEPSMLALGAAGAAGLVGLRMRRKLVARCV